MKLLLSVHDGTGLVSLWDTPQDRAKGAANERHVDLSLTLKQQMLLAPPSEVLLKCDAYIYKRTATEMAGEDPANVYEVWLVPVGDRDNIINGFIAACVDTFDKATAALMAVTGIHITRIVSEV